MYIDDVMLIIFCVPLYEDYFYFYAEKCTSNFLSLPSLLK